MKKFTDYQKKWALTSCLMLVLGYNVSMHKSVTVMATSDFASTSEGEVIESKIPTANGQVKIKYTGLKDGSTLAQVTEGKICETCGDRFTLSLGLNKDNVDQLNVALLQYVSNNQANASTPQVVATNLLESVKNACSAKSAGVDQIDCFTNRFVDALTRKKSTVSADEANAFYKENIEPLFIKQMRDSTTLLSQQRHAAAGLSDGLYAITMSGDDPSQINSAVLSSIEKMMGKIPKQYSQIRNSLIHTEESIIRNQIIDMKDTYAKSQDKQNSQAALIALQESNLKRNDALTLVSNIKTVDQNGLLTAGDLGNMDKNDVNQVYSSIQNYANHVIESLNTNPFDMQTPDGSTTSPTTPGMYGGTITGGTLVNPSTRAASGRTGLTGLNPDGTNVTNSAGGSMTFSDAMPVTPDMQKFRNR